jgi:hypothetical protein
MSGLRCTVAWIGRPAHGHLSWSSVAVTVMAVPLLSDPGQGSDGRADAPAGGGDRRSSIAVRCPRGVGGRGKGPAAKPPTSPQPAKLLSTRQHIDAEVAEVDQSHNSLTLKTKSTKFRLEANPAVPADFKKGDRIVLEIGILSSAHPVATTPDSP